MTAADGRWPDLAGRLITDAGNGVGRHHVMGVRVYFEDTDFSGVVYHATYLRWCERGRSDFLRLLGNDHRSLIDGAGGGTPAAFVVRRMAIDYLKPARIDDVVEVVTRTTEIGAAHVILQQAVNRDDAPLFTATVTVVLLSLAGRPMRLSKSLRGEL